MILICGERQERNVAGAFNGDSHLTLMLGAVARNAARKNFAALGRETAELSRVFVIYSLNFIDAKRTNFSARASTSFSAHFQSSLKRRVVRVNRFAAKIIIIISFGRSRFATIGIIIAAAVLPLGIGELDIINPNFYGIDFPSIRAREPF